MRCIRFSSAAVSLRGAFFFERDFDFVAELFLVAEVFFDDEAACVPGFLDCVVWANENGRRRSAKAATRDSLDRILTTSV
jgi:hypothetical protein